MTAIRRILRSTRGVSMVEYAVMLALIAVVCIGAISGMGSSVNKAFKTVAGCSGNGGGQDAGGSANGGGGGFGCTGGVGATSGGGGSGGSGTGAGGGSGGGPGHGKP